MIHCMAYEDQAMIPTKQWRAPKEAERKILIDGICRDDFWQNIGIVRVPAELLSEFDLLQSAAQNHCPQEEIMPYLGASSIVNGIAAVKKYVRDNFEVSADNEQLPGGIGLKPPSLPTVTTSPHTGKLVGLHLDDWYHLPLSRRAASPNRISINLGLEDRFLLFLNLTVGQIYAAVSVAKASCRSGLARRIARGVRRYG
jgi:hypothetical protein